MIEASPKVGEGGQQLEGEKGEREEGREAR